MPSWQTIKDIAYTRQNALAAYAHWPFIALSFYALNAVFGWMGQPVSRWQAFLTEMSIFPFLYLLFCLLNYHYLWSARKLRRYRYTLWITDSLFDQAIPFLDRNGVKRSDYRRKGGDWNGENGEWRNEIGFARADHYMLAKMRF